MVQDWSYTPSADGSTPTSPIALDFAPDLYLDCSSPRYRSYCFLTSPTKMPSGSKGKGKAAGPVTTSAPMQLSFVTANNPDQFRDKAVMRQVRKTVMHNFLHEAKNDPNSTDVRVRNKRASATSSPPQQMLPPAATGSGSAAPGASSPPLRRDSHADLVFNLDQQIETYFQGPRTSTSGATYNPASREVAFSDEVLIPPPPMATPPAHMQNADGTSFTTSSIPADWVGCTSLIKHVKEAQDFLTAYSQEREQRDRQLNPDPFASCEPLPSSLDLKLLKGNCTKYFGSYAMAKQWVPLQLQSREAFLASLCISAPYTDLMSLKASEPVSKARPDSKQTLEILDVVPRMIGLTLNDPEARSSDSNFVAITQLFCGELTSQYTDMLAWHPNVLKMLVNERGGLDKLGGNGVIAANISVTNLEANVLQNQSSDPMYTSWAERYLSGRPFQRQLAPEGPLYSTTNGMKSFAEHKWCLPQTLQLVMHMHNLTETFLRLGRLESEWTTADISSADQDREKSNLRNTIRRQVDEVHDLPTCHELGILDYSGWIYETVRLTSLLYSRAIWSRKPFHEWDKLSYRSSRSSFLAVEDNQTRVTPEMIQDALEKTPMFEVWDRLAGVLYWVLMVSASACYALPSTATSEGGSPIAEHPGVNTLAQEMLRRKGHKFTRSGSVPLGPTQSLFTPPEQTLSNVYKPPTSSADMTADQFRDFLYTMNTTPVSASTTDFAHGYTSAPINVPVPPSGTIRTDYARQNTREYQLGETGFRGSSPDSVHSTFADQGRGAGSWTTITHSGPASGSHTPSPPSSVPSSITGIPIAENLATCVPSASTFDFTTYYSPTMGAMSHPSRGSINNPFLQQQPQAGLETYPGMGIMEPADDSAWTSMLNTFMVGNPGVQHQMEQQQIFQQQQQQQQQQTMQNRQSVRKSPDQSRHPAPPVEGAGDRNKRVRRAPMPTVKTNEDQVREHRAFVKRYLTANAVRVSILLRFEHTVAIVDGLMKLVACQRFLNRA